MYNVKRGIIASCQPRRGGFMIDDAWKLAKEAEFGGAVAVRIEGNRNVHMTASAVDIPVIGLTKEMIMGSVWITPYLNDAIELVKSGADYVAADATGKYGYDEVKKMADAGVKVIGDVASLTQAKEAQRAGCVAVTTALAGYTSKCVAHEFDEPDYELVAMCVDELEIPVIAEGRVFTNSQALELFELGAHSVCIGGAITLPDKITRRFCEVCKW